MASATTTATAAGFTSSLSGLPDQVLLAHTRSLVLHEQALQLAVLDHLREIHARHLHLRLGFSSLFDYTIIGSICRQNNGLPVTRVSRYCFRNPLVYRITLIRSVSRRDAGGGRDRWGRPRPPPRPRP